MKKTNCFLLLCVFSLSMILSGCAGSPEPVRLPLEGVRNGTATGEGDGFARDPNPAGVWWTYYENIDFGRPIRVTVTVLDGFITEVVIHEDHDESLTHVGRVMEMAPQVIIAHNAFNLEASDFVDVVTAVTPTLTLRGINQAGNNALDMLRTGN